MLKKHTILNLLFCLFGLTLSAQNLSVQTWNYESTTRDTLIEFPDVNHNDYEKILMYYSMRCKDGLVSLGQQGLTNRGCGEWDYSCNTSIIDSSRIDSMYSISPTHIITGFDGEEYNYTSQATYSYTHHIQYDVFYENILTENEASIGTGTSTDSPMFGANNRSRSQLLYQADALLANGLTAGNITGLKINMVDGAVGYNNLRIRLKTTTKTSLSTNDWDNSGWQEVYFLDTDFEGGNHHFKFYSDFEWDGVSNILVDISYENDGSSTTSVLSSEQTETSSLYADAATDFNIEVVGAGYGTTDTPFEEISDEVTIALWQYGDAAMPLNSTIFEGRDNSNRRQVNAHLPWGNGEVYWDCGNDGSYDRINKSADASTFKNQWNHWAFTKNTNTGSMKIYLNGNLWHSGTGKTKPIDVQELRIGGAITWDNPYYGKIDEFSIWNVELSTSEIQAWMNRGITSGHPSYNHLLAYYKFDENGGTTMTDASPYGRDGVYEGPVTHRQRSPATLDFDISTSNHLPNITFVQTNYSDATIEPIEKIDSLINIPNQVQFYSVQGTDLSLDDTQFFYEAGAMPVYDAMGNLIDSVIVVAENTIDVGTLEHYTKHPSKIELLSFVTPYGINLDLGIEGKTWVFDVTDFGPILKGRKRLLMDRGGQWQEDMDIRFEYIEGTPSRDVLEMQQVWRVSSEGYTRINDDTRFEPVMMSLHPDASAYKLKAAVTGHGQEGEFIPRQHYLNVDGGVKEMEWQVWKECSENPVYPQGGTWIYDRAGWCPGMATDVQELDFTPFVTPGQEVEIDYGMENASGDSRYIVNVQMVTYGAPHFAQDAELVDIINPSQKVEYGRLNPVCGKPKILIRNNGTAPLTSLEITYDINGNNTQYHTWTGNLDYLETEEVELPQLNASVIAQENATFNVSIGNPNGGSDEYTNNNMKSSTFDVVPQRTDAVVIQLRTNNAGGETSWRLYDVEGNLLASRIWGLSANTTYIDTIPNLSGCYRLEVRDSDDDGISFWANNDGGGNVSISNLTSLPINVWDAIATDFGGYVVYEFIAGDLSPTEELGSNRLFEVFPNPSAGKYQVNLGGFEGKIDLRIINQIGQVIEQRSIQNAYQAQIENLDLSELDNGIYYLQVIENQQVLSKKLIKTN